MRRHGEWGSLNEAQGIVRVDEQGRALLSALFVIS